MQKRFRIYTDHFKGIPVGDALYCELTESKAKQLVKKLAARGVDAIYSYSAIDSAAK